MNRTALAALLALTLVAASQGEAVAQSGSFGSSTQWTRAKKQRVARAATAATDCIARQSLDHPGILAAYRADNLRLVTDSVWSQCQTELDHLSRDYADLHGWGTGYVFVERRYRADVPRAVRERIKDEIERRFAMIAAADENAKTQLALLYQCTDAQLHHLVGSAERAELLAAAAMTYCSREITAAIDANIDALRAKAGIHDIELGNLRLDARNAIRGRVLARAVQELADTHQSRRVPFAAPMQSAPKPPEADRRRYGTGFVASEQGHILTNAHVVRGCAEPKVFAADASVFKGRVLARDERNDLALIATTMRSAVPRFRTGVKLGESISVFGYPLAGLLASSGNFATGNVTATTGMADDISMLQISAPVQPGNSGGPLLDETGNVVGLVVGKLDALKVADAAKDIPQNVNFAIRAAIATAFLEANSIDFKMGDRGPARPPEEIAEQAQKISVRIQCDLTHATRPTFVPQAASFEGGARTPSSEEGNASGRMLQREVGG
jgi:S1-C subfamily serine protease